MEFEAFNFMKGFNYKKAVQMLNFLANKNGGQINKMKALKLIWLSDRLHLRKYGRTITGDEYFALPNGPIPSASRDLLESKNFRASAELDYANEYLKTSLDKFCFESIKEVNEKVFSQTDKEVLAKIFEEYKELSQFELAEYSHKYPEWKKFESELSSKSSLRFRIDLLDFFKEKESKTKVDTNLDTEISKEIFIENSDLIALL